MDYTTITAKLAQYYESNLPAILAEYGVDDFDYYISVPTVQEDVKELSFSLGGGFLTKSSEIKNVMMTATLYRVDNPTPYADALEKLWRGIDIEKLIGFMDKEYTFEPFYANVDEEAGNSSFLVYELIFSNQLDDCE
jgi:hypothetical protein